MFEAYENRHKPHVTVHTLGCGQLRKRGSEHKPRQGCYKTHGSLAQAIHYANVSGMPVINCSYCYPALPPSARE